MTITAQALIPPKFASTVLTADYTAAAKTIVDAFTVTNCSGGASGLSVYVVPASGSPGADNCVVNTRIVAVNESYIVSPLLGQVIESGSAIWCVSDAGNALVLFASGRVIT